MYASKRVLITGGNGYVASRLARRFVTESSAQVIAWLHAASEDEFERKKLALEEQLDPASKQRVQFSWGDLREEYPFARVDPASVNLVIHAAAITRFNVEQDLARQVNVEGSEKLFEFCERCPDLERLAYVSTVYSSGLLSGAIEERPFDSGVSFANHYESSKWQAERILLTRYARLPWQIYRIATIVSEDDGGAVGQYNAFHNTLKLLYYGLLPVLPGTPAAPLYLVTGQFVAEAIFGLLQASAVRAIYHVAHTREDAISLGELVELAFSAFRREAGFSKRRVLPPLYTDQASFERLADNVQGFGAAVTKQALASVAPFSKQLFLNKDVRNPQLIANMRSYRAPDQHKLVARICDYLVATRWGREAQSSKPLQLAAP